jgi:peptidoglycan hydrolase-like protein with peptidoglycan-binding domain
MSLEILALFAILLAKAQKVLTPASAANDHQQAANQAAKEAADAAARGDHATATTKQQEANAHAATAATAAKAARTPPPWPQVVPAELAPFPGPGWQPANPVTSAQSARAWQLLPELWKYGEGTWKVEKTADRWVVYKAAQTSPGKKGVVAYTTQQASQTVPKINTAAPADTTPAAMRPQAPPVPRPPMTAPAGPTVPASTHAAAPASGMPTLRLTSPRMTGPSVVWLQQKLGIAADGTFGTGTDAAVRHYQAAHGLTADGVVGNATWASLGVGQGRAAA